MSSFTAVQYMTIIIGAISYFGSLFIIYKVYKTQRQIIKSIIGNIETANNAINALVYYIVPLITLYIVLGLSVIRYFIFS